PPAGFHSAECEAGARADCPDNTSRDIVFLGAFAQPFSSEASMMKGERGLDSLDLTAQLCGLRDSADNGSVRRQTAMPSSVLRTSAGKGMAIAARFSLKCATFDVPGITRTLGARCKSQAMATM